MQRIVCICMASIVLLVSSGCQVNYPSEYIEQPVSKSDDGPSSYEPMLEESDITQYEIVWIPRTGKRYHRNKSCSGMKNPSEVTVEEAADFGFTPCGNCY